MPDSRDFDAMEAALGETARGRWFLGEVAQRARSAETGTLLAALARIERAVLRPEALTGPADPAPRAASPEPILLPRAVQAGLRPVQAGPGPAAQAILDAAEQVQETAWAMRESGAEPGLCDRLDRSAAAIYAACAEFGAMDGIGEDPAHEPEIVPAATPEAAPEGAAPDVDPASRSLADLARFLHVDPDGDASGRDRARSAP